MRFIMVSPYVMISLLLLCFLRPTLSSSSDDDLVTELISLSRNSTLGTIELSDELLSRIMSVFPRRSFFFAVFFYTNQFDKNARLHPLSIYFESVSVSFSESAGQQHWCSCQRHDLPYYRRDIFFFDMEWEKSAASFSLFGVNAVPQIRIVSPNVDDLRNSVNLDQGERSSFTKSLTAMLESKIRVSVEPPPSDNYYSRTTRMKLYTAFFLLAIIKIVYGSTSRLEGEDEKPLTIIFAFFLSLSNFIANLRNPSGFAFIFFLWFYPFGILYTDKNEAVAVMHVTIGLMVAVVTHELLRLKHESDRKMVVVFTLLFSFWAVKLMFDWSITEHVFQTDI